MFRERKTALYQPFVIRQRALRHTPFGKMPANRKPDLIVRRRPGRQPWRGLLLVGGSAYACNLGKTGVTVRKCEADGATPAARMSILGGYRKPGAYPLAPHLHRLRIADAQIGWCDEPRHANYNRAVKLPLKASHENLLRADRLYDICLVLDWNYLQRARNRGSAIFMHLTNANNGPTKGCIAIEPALMRRLLPKLLTGISIRVLP